MFTNNTNKSEVSKKHYQKTISYEDDKNHIQGKSNKLAWIVAGIFCFFSLISWAGLYFMLPLKEVTPFVIRVDNTTGIPDIITAIDESTLSSDEALDRYFINQYIQLREVYTYQTIQKTYELTQLFSSSEIAEGFRNEYNQPDSLDNFLATGTATVKVISISLEKINMNNLANVRFQIDYVDSKNTRFTRNFISRIAYKYNPQQKLNLSHRIENPIGFQVTSYQRIEENL